MDNLGYLGPDPEPKTFSCCGFAHKLGKSGTTETQYFPLEMKNKSSLNARVSV